MLPEECGKGLACCFVIRYCAFICGAQLLMEGREVSVFLRGNKCDKYDTQIEGTAKNGKKNAGYTNRVTWQK